MPWKRDPFRGTLRPWENRSEEPYLAIRVLPPTDFYSGPLEAKFDRRMSANCEPLFEWLVTDRRAQATNTRGLFDAGFMKLMWGFPFSIASGPRLALDANKSPAPTHHARYSVGLRSSPTS